VHLSRAPLFSFAWLLFAGVAAAQTLVIGPEVPLEIPIHPVFASNVRLASSGEGFAAIWQTDAGELVSMLIDAGGELRGDTVHVLARHVTDAVIAGNAAGYLAAWRDGERLVWAAIALDGSTPAPATALKERGLEDFSITANQHDFAIAWRRSDDYAAVRVAVISANGKLRQPPMNVSTDPTAGPASIAGGGSTFFVAYRTSRGIETSVIDGDRVALIARRVAADAGADPLIVNTAAGPEIFFSLSLNGFTDDAATYRIDGIGQPEFVAYGRLLHALIVDGVPMLVVRNDGATEIAGLPLRFGGDAAMAWNGAHFLIVAGAPAAQLVLADREGLALRTFPFAPPDRFPRGLATAAGVELVLWSDFQESEQTYYARFRGGRMLDASPRVSHSGERTAAASDGTSTFLVVFRDAAGSVYADFLPAGGGPSAAPILLGRGEPQAAIWNGQAFIVLWTESRGSDRELHAASVRSDGTGLLTKTIQKGIGDLSVAAAPATRDVIFVLYERWVGITFTLSRSLFPNQRSTFSGARSLTIASDGGARVILGLLRGETPDDFPGSRMLRLDDSATPLWTAAGAPLRSVWTGSVFLSCDATGCVLFNSDDGFYDLADLPHFPLPPHDGELFLAAANGRTVGLYGRRARLFTRTFTPNP
jgi:hypothetical protein